MTKTLVALFLFLGMEGALIAQRQDETGPPDKAKEDTPIGFTDTIKRISDSRNRIHSYDLTVTCRVDNTLTRVKDTNQVVWPVVQTPVSAMLMMVYDKKQSKFLVARQDTRLTIRTNEKETACWRVFGRTLESIEDNERNISRGRFIGSPVEFFDPLALGLSFEAEIRGGDRWEKVVASYLNWKDNFRVQSLEDGRIRYENTDRWFIVDTKRDYWPIAMNKQNGDARQIQTAIKLARVNGQWLPSYAAIWFPNETVIFQFNWHSVNRPIPKERFTKEDLETRFGFGLDKVVERILRGGYP